MSWYRFGTYYKKSAVGARGPPGVGFKLTKDGNYDMENKILKNCLTPMESQDVATKSYVEEELLLATKSVSEEMRDKVENTKAKLMKEISTHVVEADAKIQQIQDQSDEKYLSFRGRKPIDAKGRRIGNVSDPTEDRNVVNKRYMENYVENKISYATTAEGYITFVPNFMGTVSFTKFSGDALTADCKFSRNGFFRVGVFLDPSKLLGEPIEVTLTIGYMRYIFEMKVAIETSWFGEAKQGDQLKLNVQCEQEFTIQPFIKIEEIKW